MAQIALVVDQVRHRGWLENQLVKAEHHVLLSSDVAQLRDAHDHLQEQPELWLLLLSAGRLEEALDYIESVSSAPTIVLDDWPAQSQDLARWYGQLARKLESSLRSASLERDDNLPEEVWLLGASLGGPEAVAEFMRALPAGLDVAFVYVQHIEEAFDQALVTNLNRTSGYHAVMFQRECRLTTGEVLIVAPEVKPRFLPFGRVIAASKPWSGQYRPGIDEVAKDMARIYRENLGLIVFSGTYNDGEAAARTVGQYGGRVWAQEPRSCICPTMPQAAISTGLVRVSGSPTQLAATLASRVKQSRQAEVK